MSIEGMRLAIIAQYPNSQSWLNRVTFMPVDQVCAVYARLCKDGTLHSKENNFEHEYQRVCCKCSRIITVNDNSIKTCPHCGGILSAESDTNQMNLLEEMNEDL